ncbi:MAG: redox-sensing transcriptional repressor Rex [Armatimonadota bacterium]
MTTELSTASLRRLPRYLRLLVQLLNEGHRFVTSAELARRLAMDESLVRRDLALTHFSGKPRVGFEVERLKAHLEAQLGLGTLKRAFLIGAGRLGQALAAYRGFSDYGLRICGIFDTDPEKIGREVSGMTVQPLWTAPALARDEGIQVVILAVPAEAAQGVADMLADAGVPAFWNFSGHPLHLPAPVIVLNEDLSDSLAVLSFRLTHGRESAARNGDAHDDASSPA